MSDRPYVTNCYLDGYAIIPVEKYDRLRAQLATAREALRHIASNPTMGEGGMKWRARQALADLRDSARTEAGEGG